MGLLLLFSPLRPISRGGSRVLPPLPLAGLRGQIKACRGAVLPTPVGVNLQGYGEKTMPGGVLCTPPGVWAFRY
jgi:hypothetical protein